MKLFNIVYEIKHINQNTNLKRILVFFFKKLYFLRFFRFSVADRCHCALMTLLSYNKFTCILRHLRPLNRPRWWILKLCNYTGICVYKVWLKEKEFCYCNFSAKKNPEIGHQNEIHYCIALQVR